ncbi:hypothetical protein [Salisaeta longa]|uniref:hypothetical protein n=1 Tax=Salisaeta longa TaxID=503170 RepID=UPI0003B2EFB1|nr:hypothetical protein [Salisaeta longa]
MEIKEMQKRRRELEETIGRLLKDFEDDTEVPVAGVWLESDRHPTKPIKVQVDIDL